MTNYDTIPLSDLAIEAQKGDKDAVHTLMRRVKPLIRKAVNHVIGSGSTVKVHKEDLYQEGYLTLWRVLPKYDRSKGRFDTFIYRSVRGDVARAAGYLYRGFHLPHDYLARYRKAMNAADGDPNVARQLAVEQGLMTADTFDAMDAAVRRTWSTERDNSEGTYTVDVVDQYAHVEQTVVDKATRQTVHAAMAQLSEKERRVLELTFGFDGEALSDREAGNLLGITRQAVQRTRTKAQARLADLMKENL
jgi:RNA polymerase sigma factor (sigma-70 family)